MDKDWNPMQEFVEKLVSSDSEADGDGENEKDTSVYKDAVYKKEADSDKEKEYYSATEDPSEDTDYDWETEYATATENPSSDTEGEYDDFDEMSKLQELKDVLATILQ